MSKRGTIYVCVCFEKAALSCSSSPLLSLAACTNNLLAHTILAYSVSQILRRWRGCLRYALLLQQEGGAPTARKGIRVQSRGFYLKHKKNVH